VSVLPLATRATRLTTGAKRRIALWGPVAVYMLVIFILSSQADVPLPQGLTDKQGHSLGYLGLAATVTRACVGGLGAPVSLSQGLVAIALTTGYGISDEWHQSFVPGRTADIMDLRADATGAILGTAACWLWGIIRSRSTP
jgi:VanZ family protein